MDFAREPLELGGWHGDLRAQDGLSVLRNAYLGRLRRLLRLRSHHHEELNEQGLWLLDRSVFATYRDCVGLGMGFAAQDIIRRFSAQGRGLPHSPVGDIGDPAGRRQG
jgi:hypothetical protein